jgi:membrane carboxypeptidase/penicillin-binding protein
MLAGFEGVVNNKAGTANAAFAAYARFPSNYVIAGKTGTADVGPDKEPNSWFVGFGPTDPTPGTPEYVVAVVVDHGGYGAQAAAPAVAQIYNYLYANPVQPVRIPTANNEPSTTPPSTVPPAAATTTTTTTTPTAPTTTTTTTPSGGG